jgi:rSAM/selenodomain-associated transferase 2
MRRLSISVVIPTLNEAAALPAALASLAGCGAEVIVVDGGSVDGTPCLARGFGATVLGGVRGRGAQLRLGAGRATGDVVLFLHADTRLGPGALDAIRASLAAPKVVGGNFRLVFDGEDGFSRWLTGFYAWLRRRGLFYGDSAIFVRRAALEAVGGVRPIALMEDFDLVRRLARAGLMACVDTPPALTSSRRFRGRSPWRIVAGWLAIHALYVAGVDPERLARLYRSEGGRS